MNVRSFPHSGRSPHARSHAVDIDHLLTLTNSRLFALTGEPDVIATRLGLRHLKRLGMRALVVGVAAQVGPVGAQSCANDGAGC
jgi:hypothetical protein